MGAPFTLQQLLDPVTEAALRARSLAIFQKHRFPAITEWALNPIGTESVFVDLIVKPLNTLLHSGAPVDKQIAAIAAARVLRYARGPWLTILASDFYLLERNPATRTTFNMNLTSVPSAPTYTFQVGDVWLVGPSGKRYQSTTGGTVPPGGSLPMSFAAEADGSAYSDDPSVSTLVLATSPAGLVALPGGGDFTPVAIQGDSSGRITPRRTSSSAPLPHSFTIRIDTAGEPNGATYSLRTDAGAFVNMGVLFASGNALPDGTTIDAVAGISPSFEAGEVYVFSTPGTPNYVQGDDEEDDEALRARCQGRWPSLSDNILDGKVTLWTVTAYPAVNRIQVSADTVTPGRFIVTVADSHGAVDQAVLDKIAAFITPKLNVDEGMTARSTSTLAIATSGNVKYRGTPDELAQLQADAQDGWIRYLGTLPMGSEVEVAKLEQIIMDAGALDAGVVDVLRLNGIAGNIQLATGVVPVDGNPAALAGAMTWMQG